MTTADAVEDWAAVHGPRLKGAALLLCRDQHEADDLVQETLARLYQRWSRVRRADDPAAYARSTLSNLYISRWRRWRAERSKHHLVESRDIAPDNAQTVADRDALDSWLATLGTKQRIVVALRYYCDQSTTQIADVLGIREATVRTQLMRALARLRERANEPFDHGARPEREGAHRAD